MNTELTVPNKVEADPILTALNAAGVTTAKIDKLQEDFKDLIALPAIMDDKQREEVRLAQVACRDIRKAVEGALKLERDEAIRHQRFVLQEEKRIIGDIAKAEDPLKKLLADYDNREQLRIQEEAKAWAAKMELRKQAAFDVGFRFDGSNYVLDKEDGTGPWVLRDDQVAGMAMGDEAFYSRLEEIGIALAETRSINQELAAKAEEERLAKEAQHQALLRRQEEMEARERALNERVNAARKNELIAIGMVVNDDPDRKYMDELIVGDVVRDIDALHLESDEDWANTLAEVKQGKAEYDSWIAEQEKAAARAELAAKRVTALHAAGYMDLVQGGRTILCMGFDDPGPDVYEDTIADLDQADIDALVENGNAILAERKRKHDEHVAQMAIERERLRVADEAEAKERREKEAAAKAGDKQKVESLAHRLHCEFIDTPMPELKSAVGKSAMKTYAKQFAEIHASMIRLSKEL